MILKPDDVLQKGDIIFSRCPDTKPEVVEGGWIGKSVGILSSFFHCFDYVERREEDDPRNDEERELDQLNQEWRETINSVRPGG